MPDWVKSVFLNILPRILMMRRPNYTPRYSMEFDDQEPTPKKEPLNCIDNNSKATQLNFIDDHSKATQVGSAKADLEKELQQMAKDEKNTKFEVMAVAETLKDLHLECDWLLSNFEARKEARSGEIDALKKAKAVLSGAD